MKIIYRIFIGLGLVIAVLSLLGAVLPLPKPPAAGRIITLPDGTRINTYTKGEGPAIVLIHGLPGSAQDWPETADALVAKGFQVTWYDRVGYGHSSRRQPERPFTYQANADELDALIAAMGLDAPALVGWSFGGGVVQFSKAARQEDTPFIVLLAAVGPAMKIEGKIDQMRATEWVLRMPFIGAVIARASISSRFAETMPARWVGVQRSLLLMPGTLDTLRGERNGHSPSVLSPGDITTPTLIIHGTKDPMVDYAVGMDLSKIIPNSKLITLDGIGHMIPLSHPQEIADAIATFSSGLRGENP
ncbi:MAG: alpha/beta hydrolase [Robiginitomaculum sp.]|nr:alpha/beta hydrolase [Robiginitomaculum sp.]